MASRSKGKGAKMATERSTTKWTIASIESSALLLSVVKEAATSSPIAELKRAACKALEILQTIQTRKNNVKENKEAYERLGDDSSGLIAVIWRSFKKAEVPEEWLSVEMRDILEDLTHTLESICAFVQEQLSKSKAIRVIFSRADGVKINEYREHLNYAMQKFELQSHMNINDVLLRVVKKNDQISEQILHRNEEEDVNYALAISARDARDREIMEIHREESEKIREISKLERLKQVVVDREAEDERWHSEELKKINQETKERKLELERLRAAASAAEEANRLKEKEEEEIAQLKQTLASQEHRRSNRQGKKQCSREEEEEEEEEEEWGGSVMVEEATSEDEEDRPMRRSSKVKKNSSKSPKRRPVAVEESTDDEEDLQYLRSSKTSKARRKLSSASLREEDLESMKSLKTRMARRNLSSASLRAQEMQDDYTDDEVDYTPLPPKKNPKFKGKPRTSLGNLPRDVNDLMAQFQGFTPMGLPNPHYTGLGSPMYIPGIHSNPYIPTYGPPFSPSMVPYGHGVGVPGTVVNSGVGNITNTTIANVGNDNSVRKIYRSPRSQRRGVGN